MALDTTIGGASSDSYATLAEYTAYASARNWTIRGTDAENEADLRRAADYIDWNFEFLGVRQYQTQKRDWPRLTSTLVNDWPIDPDTVPDDIKSAQMEIAYQYAQGVDPLATVTATVSRKRVKAGPVETETEYTGGLSTPRIVSVEGLLRPYLEGGTGSGMVRVARG